MALTKITTSVIAANTLGTANIADNSIDATKIAANSILTRHIDDDQITGDQLADNITIAGNLTVTGNLTTNGSSVTNSSTNTTIEDTLIELGTGTSGSPSNDSGIILERGSSDNIFIGFDESADKVMVATTSATGASTGNLTLTAAPLVTGALTASGLSYPTSDGSDGQVIKTDGSGALSFSNVSTSTSVSNYTATGDGSTTAFDTGTNPTNEINTWVFVDGVYQQKSVYSYSGSTITFATAPESGAKIDVVTGITSGIQDSNTVLGIFEATTTNTATYATSLNAAHENNTWVFVGGVYQPKDSYTFSTSGSLVFDANTPVGEKLAVVTTKALTASAVTTDSIAASAVTTAKIADNAITSAKIPNNSIVGADISATTNITANTFTGALTGNVTGNVTGNLTGTIQTAAQPNITSVGTLSALTVSGNLNATVTTAAQPNITSVGTLSSLTVSNSATDYEGLQVLNTNTAASPTTSSILLGITNSVRNVYTKIQTIEGGSDANETRLAFYTNNTSNTLTEALRIDENQNVGIGETTPLGKLHVKSADSGAGADSGADELVIEGSGDSGLSILSGASNYGTILFSDSGDSAAGRMRYEHNNNALNFGTNGSWNRMYINSSGNVGIGATPSYKLDVQGAAGDVAIFRGDANNTIRTYLGSSYQIFQAYNGTNTNQFGYVGDAFYIQTAAAERMRIDSSGKLLLKKTSSAVSASGGIIDGGEFIASIGSSANTYLVYNTTGSAYSFYVNGSGQIYAAHTGISSISDERLKENIVDLETGLPEIMSLKPRRFDWKNGDGKNIAGFVAQEVETVFPDLVDNYLHDELDDAKSVRMGDMLPTLVKAVQEQQAQIDELKAKLESK